ncbi:MAG TPA: nitrile hydratase subunit alpha [Candidatus Limnocylindrales bacterium]|nr:nitrile hydratase subunit alpha [Candidatus Limnocylindrales bacterium]
MTDDHGHHPQPPSDLEARTLALESLLVEKGLLTSEAIDRIVTTFERDIGPLLGARAVAHAWVDPAYKARLLSAPKAALAELGITEHQVEELVVVENTPATHNVIVCTLCSCYPWAVLGLPPTWYKSAPYRSRVVIEPRVVLHEMGLELPDEVAIRVWDSSADIRYLVLPERPAGTEGWAEDRLAAIVTRDTMIGVARPAVPDTAT